jgi:rod shape-determining protein MreD
LRVFGGEGQEKKQVPLAGALVLFLLCSLLEVLEAKILPPALHVHFLFIAVLYLAWYTTQLKGAVAGSLLGLVEDYLFGFYLGLNGLSKTLIGFFMPYLSRWTSAELGSMRLVLIVAIALLDRGIVYGMLYLLTQRGPETSISAILSSAFVTGLAGEVCFRLYDRFRFPPSNFRGLR